MTDDILQLADDLWEGKRSIDSLHPVGGYGPGVARLGENAFFVATLANVSGFVTQDGLLMVDTGSPFTAQLIHDAVRRMTPLRLNMAVYSHGHIDHVFGLPIFEAESTKNGWPAPQVVAHRAVPERFDRYILTAGYNSVINQRQFGVPGLAWPTEYRYPDHTYDQVTTLNVGGRRFELHHAKGETDDHTWTWVPDDRVLCCGDLFIWASPNAGNPQKVQRYPLQWAQALREMAQLRPSLLLPGHGLPVVGEHRVVQALQDTAELLESLVGQTLDLMNSGARLDDVLFGVQVPDHLAQRPYLQPVYDEPEFVLRNIWRLYGGWWDGNPASLKPAPEKALANELAALAGGAGALAERALDLATADSGDRNADEINLRLAGHLAELAAAAAPSDPGIHKARADVFRRRADYERSTMSKGVFNWASREQPKGQQ